MRPHPAGRWQWLLAVAITLVATTAAAAERYAMKGMVLKLDPARKTVAISHEHVPGVMAAMIMTFTVRDWRPLAGVAPGTTLEFRLVVEPDGSYIDSIRLHRYRPLEQDPMTANRLAALLRATAPRARSAAQLAPGQLVPDFTLTDQADRRVTLAQFRGKVVALNFIYTRCALPQLCFRLSNHFGALQRRFTQRLGRDLVLLTITIDPERDVPEVLAEYGRQWNADAAVWRFLTGPLADIRRIGAQFGVDAFQDEGMTNHTTRTAVLDRQGRVVANIEGNEFTTTQLGDLVATALGR